jgi:hypothetical protein
MTAHKLNKAQLKFVMNKLGYEGQRREAMKAIILRGVSAYSAEMMYQLPKGTASRDAIRCVDKWGELLSDTSIVNDLL